MAEVTIKQEITDKESLIDSTYRKFVRGVSRAIGSTEFYEFFMKTMDCAQKEFQFSNRRVLKNVDLVWVEQIEAALDSFQNIIATPRNVIKEEELVVNVANAKKAGSETVRHLAQHSALVEDFNLDTGDVRPGKLMQRYREDTIGLYENRLVYTTMEYAHHFVKIRHDALLAVLNDEYGAKLKVNTDIECVTERVHFDMYMHIKEVDGILDTDSKHGDILSRISRMYRVLSAYLSSDFAQEMAKLPRVSGNINKTNVLKKNPNYRSVLQLWEFLKSYQEVGYSIKIVEQNPEINDRLQEDIYRNVLFNYLILKGYLEDEQDRKIPVTSEAKMKVIKPKIVKQIIEELTEDYDIPEVEIRKVLIEELTKEQLMQEEAEMRLRLVEEQEARLSEEEKKLRAEQRLEKERLRKEKEEEEERRKEEVRRQNLLDRKRAQLFREEYAYFLGGLKERVFNRREKEELWRTPKEDYADAAEVLEAAELRRQAMEAMKAYAAELKYFSNSLNKRKKLRQKQEEYYRQEAAEREQQRRERLAKKAMER